MRILRKAAVVLLLGALLGVSAAPASGGRQASRSGSRSNHRVALSFLEALEHLFTIAWGKTGCKIDPLGACINGSAAVPTGETGCGIDPFGRCATSTAESDIGCMIDPFGHCAAGP